MRGRCSRCLQVTLGSDHLGGPTWRHQTSPMRGHGALSLSGFLMRSSDGVMNPSFFPSQLSSGPVTAPRQSRGTAAGGLRAASAGDRSPGESAFISGACNTCMTCTSKAIDHQVHLYATSASSLTHVALHVPLWLADWHLHLMHLMRHMQIFGICTYILPWRMH